jgi:hypothetical protein
MTGVTYNHIQEAYPKTFIRYPVSFFTQYTLTILASVFRCAHIIQPRKAVPPVVALSQRFQLADMIFQFAKSHTDAVGPSTTPFKKS